jgi:hypothetical protein
MTEIPEIGKAGIRLGVTLGKRVTARSRIPSASLQLGWLLAGIHSAVEPQSRFATMTMAVEWDIPGY